MNARPVVVVTGCGAINALGSTADAFWDGLTQGRSGIGPVTSFDATKFPMAAAQVKEPLPAGLEGSPRALALAYVAAEEAARQAKISTLGPRERCGVVCGGTIDFPEMSDIIKEYRGEMPKRGNTLLDSWRLRLDAMATLVARRIGIADKMRSAEVVENACATGGLVIGEAVRKVRHGKLDVAIALGATSWTNLTGITVYHRLGALSPQPKPAAPFDIERSGFVMGEGSGALVLETLEHARARGVEPLAAVTGFGMTASAYRVMDMPRDAIALRQAMELALADAGRTPADIDYISAHGTATYINDMVETRAIKNLLGDRAKEVPVSSIKSMIGHTAMAAGALEAIACIYSIRRGLVPPTANLHNRDPECDLDCVPNVARPHVTRVAVSNSFGAGGSNCALVIEAVGEQDREQ